MHFQELELRGSWVGQTEIFRDERGSFREFFKFEQFVEMSGIRFVVAQANTSTSKLGVIRGVHYSTTDKGQAKWVTCLSGRINDVIVDLRSDSITYGKWISVELTSNNGKAVYIGEGFGHGFSSLEANSTVAYMLSSEYSPDKEFGINPLDSELSIDWGIEGLFPVLSKKDSQAPGFKK